MCGEIIKLITRTRNKTRKTWLLLRVIDFSDNANEPMAVLNKLENFPVWNATFEKSQGQLFWQLTWNSLSSFTYFSACVAVIHPTMCPCVFFVTEEFRFFAVKSEIAIVLANDKGNNQTFDISSSFSRFFRVVKVYLYWPLYVNSTFPIKILKTSFN